MSYLRSCELALEKIMIKDWKDNLLTALPEFEVIYPKMPNPKNARYEEWKIWFEKLFPLLRNGVILVGHSLGGIFLAKYLSENKFSFSIGSIHLVAAPYDDKDCDEPLVDFSLSGGVGRLAELTNKIFLYHSRDDKAVPFVDLSKYEKDLPSAQAVVFEDRGHFNQEQFPELVINLRDN